MKIMTDIKKQNEKIISMTIDRHFGPGSYQKIKSNPEAVQTLINYITKRKSIAVRGCA